MAKRGGKGGVMHKNPYNEVSNTDPNSPDVSGAGLYVSYGEVIGMQLSEADADLECTPNSDSGRGIMGGPAPGEPNPSDMPSEG